MTIPGRCPGGGCGTVDDEAAWCVETARSLRRGAGEVGGSSVFLQADDARRLADVLDKAADARRVPNVEAPLDANGEWLCHGDVAMTESGDRVVVVGIGMDCVFAVDADADGLAGVFAPQDARKNEVWCKALQASRLTRAPHDSWDLLAVDADKGCCEYYGGSGTCSDCCGPALSEVECSLLQCKDLIARATRLRRGERQACRTRNEERGRL